MIDMDKVARHVIRAEADREEAMEPGSTSRWWADLVIAILDETAPDALPRISDLIVGYLTEEG